MPRLIKEGKFIRPALGIQAAPPQFLERLGISKGVAVVGVVPKGAAQVAGIQPFQRGAAGEITTGDVVTSLGQKQVSNLDELLEALEQHRPGDTITLTVTRAGKPVEVVVRLQGAE